MGRTAMALGMIMGGIVLAGIGYFMVGADVRGFNPKNTRNIEKTYTCENEVRSVRISERSGGIIVQKGKVDHAVVEYFDRKDKSEYEISESDGELLIERKKEKGFSFFEINFFSEPVMTVTVPEDLEGELNVSDKSGSIRISDIGAEQITVSNMSGSVKLDNAASASDLTVNNTSGSITLKDAEAAGDITVSNTSGSIRVENLKSGGNISLKNTSGSIKGTIAGKESDYRITAKVVSGSCSLKNSDQGSRDLNVSNTSGSISLSFTE